MERIVTIPTAGISQAMAAYTIGFVKLEVHNRVEARSAPAPERSSLLARYAAS
jgi:hypothetical protein